MSQLGIRNGELLPCPDTRKSSGGEAVASSSSALTSPQNEISIASEVARLRIRCPTTGTMRNYTMEEVAKHDKEGDCWFVIGNINNGGPKIYDISNYLDDHPGGAGILLDLAGRDADADFEDVNHSAAARKELERHQIGVLKLSAEELGAKREGGAYCGC